MTVQLSNVGAIENVPAGTNQADAQAYAAAAHRRQKQALAFKSITARPGMHVELAASRGYTKKGVLTLPYRFQVPPTDAFTRQLAFSHSDFDTLRAGQHSRPQSSQLAVVHFNTLVVDWNATFSVWPSDRAVEAQSQVDNFDTYNVLRMTDDLEEVLNSGTPVRLRAGMAFLWDDWDVNGLYTLRALSIEERGGEPDARYLDVELHEYRPLRLDRRRYGKAGKQKPGGGVRGKSDLPTTVQIFADGSSRDLGDNNRKLSGPGVTLARLSTHYYGSAENATLIIKANGMLTKYNWTPNRNLGQLATAHFAGRPFKLRIPRAPEHAGNPRAAA